MENQPIVFINQLIVVLDISDELPRHKNWPYNYRQTDRYRLIPNRPIERVYWHHTAGGIAKGINGPMATANFCVTDPDPINRNAGGRGWPGMPYHLYIPYEPERTTEGQLIIYQCQSFDLWTWHTSGKSLHGRRRNKYGIGVVCQGRFWSRHTANRPSWRGQTGRPSLGQRIASWSLWFDFLKPRFELINRQISGHFESGKPTCPGDDLEAWVTFIKALPENSNWFADVCYDDMAIA